MANVRVHETLSLTSVVSPATTLAQIRDYGSQFVLCSTADDVRFTLDGITTPVVTADSEVGTLLRSTDLGIIITADEFLNSKWVSVSGTARVQFEFLQGDHRRF